MNDHASPQHPGPEPAVRIEPPTSGGRLLGGLLLFAALILGTAGAVVFLLPPGDDDPGPAGPTPSPTIMFVDDDAPSDGEPLGIVEAVTLTPTSESPDAPPQSTPMPTDAPTEAPSLTPTLGTPLPTWTPAPTRPAIAWAHPTAAADEIAAALLNPVGSASEGAASEPALARNPDPFTIQPARARDGVITYTVQQGDNLAEIAERFGLQQSTIIWSNDRFYVNAMRVGMELNILPVDGVYYRVIEPQTVSDVAASYGVTPYDIIDSEHNNLFGASPETALPSGLYVVIPGGEGSTEPIYWDPGISINEGSAGDGPANQGSAQFGAASDPGSCGRQTITGGTPPYSNPIRINYRITQDYTWNHTGIDLGVPVGTGVFAAGGGTVVFSGWSSWGYGYTVVIAHGSTMSLYGHLNGPLVSCGQVVSAGEGIGVSGNTGRSSGPHLHFEIRAGGGSPTNPWDYIGF